MNVVTVIGRLSRPAEERILPSGGRLLQLDVSVARDGERAETVPVVWFDPPASASNLDTDEEVILVGRVRRRFFKSANGTQSRTEVVADKVVPTKRTKPAAAVLEEVYRRLEAADGS
jgi:single-strand DNA-binding protein